MSTPPYRWVCHSCGSSNEPHTNKCSSCGFPAVASGAELERSRRDYRPPHYDPAAAETADRIWLFFPEAILGAVLVVVAPFWAIRLVLAGHFGAAVTLASGVGLAAYAFFQLLRRGHKYLAYFALVGALALAFSIHSATQ
jgi:ribosomal protein L37E